MQIQDIRRWQWTIGAIVIGLALSYVWSSVEWGEQLPSIGQPDFERGLTVKPNQAMHVDDVVVLPPQEGKYKVVCTQLRRTRNPGELRAMPVAFIADTPYKAAAWRGSGENYTNIVEYLKKVRQDNSAVAFTYAWYRETWAVYVLWTGTCLLLIGGVWPSVISLLTGGGLALKPQPRKKDEYDLSRFGKGEKEPPKPTAAPPVTAEAMDELRRLDDELERRLGGQAVVGDGAAATATATAEQPVRKLEGGPLELQQAEQDEVEKEYGGEFYPVVKAIHVHKKGEGHEEHPPEKPGEPPKH